MKNLIKKSNREINEMVTAYQEVAATESELREMLYLDIHEAVYPMCEAVAYSYYHKSKGINKDKEEFAQCAKIAVYKAAINYDIAKGADFTSLAKQLTEWTINDELFKKAKSKSSLFNYTHLSLDKPLSADSGTFFDAIEHQYATEIDEVFNSADVGEDDGTDFSSLTKLLNGLVDDFSSVAKEDEVQLVKVWISTMLSIKNQSQDIKKAVNKALEQLMPDVAPATIRKRKARVEKKFNEFAKDCGYLSFKLSHF